MINNKQVNLKDTIAQTINEYLEYEDGYKLRLITDHFKINTMTDDKYDYGCYMDAILISCLLDLHNSIAILNFIYNDFK